MEFARKIIFLCIVLFAFIFTSCNSLKKEFIDDSLVLLELTPLPKTVQVKKEILYEPIYGVMRVLEITLENGVQSQIMAKKGDVNEGLDIGNTGEIAENAAFEEIIGTFKIISVSNGFVTCKIENVTKKIPNNAYIRVITGQKIKEE